ncbi:poly-gamma-glutamate hydrolase family protein [Halovivax limisalsi]|uniref:poly-gamma-glutamate hydrolase family protein n=1 Tax=Halovivax limisalsi TaxID=1453760 RepID=UPI001FFDDB12|nr:poly-gamma-glutamate hydrolase family protein [Halovivax limisalsi]
MSYHATDRSAVTTDRRLARRTVLATGAAILGVGAPSASIAASDGPEQTNKASSAGSCDSELDRWDRPVVRTDADWDTTVSDARYCSLPCALTESTPLRIGQQIRLSGGGPNGYETAAFTVADHRDDGAVGLTDGGLSRMDLADGDGVTIGARPVHPSYASRNAARLNEEYAEYLVGDVAATSVLAMAPHGGHIELGTDFQAERVAETTGGLGWVAAGFYDGAGTYNRWHVPSIDVEIDSFPALSGLAGGTYDWTVAFHGLADDAIIVGGTASEVDRQTVADAITARLPNTPVELGSDSTTGYDGSSPINVLNRIGQTGRTLQLEQPKSVRVNDWHAVADGVADAIGELSA